MIPPRARNGPKGIASLRADDPARRQDVERGDEQSGERDRSRRRASEPSARPEQEAELRVSHAQAAREDRPRRRRRSRRAQRRRRGAGGTCWERRLATIRRPRGVAGRTIVFGSSPCFASIAASRTRAGQKTAPMSASRLRPKETKLAANERDRRQRRRRRASRPSAGARRVARDAASAGSEPARLGSGLGHGTVGTPISL